MKLFRDEALGYMNNKTAIQTIDSSTVFYAYSYSFSYF